MQGIFILALVFVFFVMSRKEDKSTTAKANDNDPKPEPNKREIPTGDQTDFDKALGDARKLFEVGVEVVDKVTDRFKAS